jgi:subtilase family serine protease
MHRRGGLLAALVVALATVGLVPLPSAAAGPTPAVATTARACGAPAPGTFSCLALLNQSAGSIQVGSNAEPGAARKGVVPVGLGPEQLASAYQLAAAQGGGADQTIAVVDAFNDPHAQADLNVYRKQFSLPPCAAECFTQVNQSGGTKLPKINAHWIVEESLDLDVASAICPLCHILLVEATNASDLNLAKAANEAVALGATEVSNSYGATEFPSESSLDPYYDHPGVVITAAAGDQGYGVEYPAVSPYAVAVGGTTLESTPSGWSETAWKDSGSGCSADEPSEIWQQADADLATACGNRAVNDVSADANPDTGVAVYDSTPDQGESGWEVIGGTSVGSVLIAAVFALAGGAPNGTTPAQHLFVNLDDLTNVTSGSNGSCSVARLCNAEPGWNGPTGLGTPAGIGAF